MRTCPPTTQRRFASTSPHRGVTLLEIVLALALTVVLVGVLNSLLDLYTRVSTAGRDQTERAQLARAILQKMEQDIRSVMFREPSQEQDDAAAAEGDLAAAEEATTVEVIDPAAAYAGASVGLFGDAQTLVLHVSRPVRGLSYSAIIDADTVVERTSDLHSVAYFLSAPGSAGLQGAAAANSPDAAAEGLARMEGDRLAMDLADEMGNLDSMAAQTNVLAPEVDFLAFRYFDGIEWFDVWDSVVSERLPQAVEIEIGLRDPADIEAIGRRYRLVVALPLAEPYVPELAL